MISQVARFGGILNIFEFGGFSIFGRRLNCKNFSKVNFRNADTYKVRIFAN